MTIFLKIMQDYIKEQMHLYDADSRKKWAPTAERAKLAEDKRTIADTLTGLICAIGNEETKSPIKEPASDEPEEPSLQEKEPVNSDIHNDEIYLAKILKILEDKQIEANEEARLKNIGPGDFNKLVVNIKELASAYLRKLKKLGLNNIPNDQPKDPQQIFNYFMADYLFKNTQAESKNPTLLQSVASFFFTDKVNNLQIAAAKERLVGIAVNNLFIMLGRPGTDKMRDNPEGRKIAVSLQLTALESGNVQVIKDNGVGLDLPIHYVAPLGTVGMDNNIGVSEAYLKECINKAREAMGIAIPKPTPTEASVYQPS
ncbi:hypothetical protein [Legionella sp. 16cNR16C]|uniref:hypothetical protein n=1 Tax=Legionella sp. 16cNR16C TaxID=2905656 RepID=UPI001E2E81C4|nr:hypothetical protein [Legionella sp. 16cNR16C]MCE3043499.1 hypothetical protein [Legionella sp. 16cNR16C]